MKWILVVIMMGSSTAHERLFPIEFNSEAACRHAAKALPDFVWETAWRKAKTICLPKGASE